MIKAIQIFPVVLITLSYINTDSQTEPIKTQPGLAPSTVQSSSHFESLSKTLTRTRHLDEITSYKSQSHETDESPLMDLICTTLMAKQSRK